MYSVLSVVWTVCCVLRVNWVMIVLCVCGGDLFDEGKWCVMRVNWVMIVLCVCVWRWSVWWGQVVQWLRVSTSRCQISQNVSYAVDHSAPCCRWQPRHRLSLHVQELVSLWLHCVMLMVVYCMYHASMWQGLSTPVELFISDAHVVGIKVCLEHLVL